MLTIFTTPRPFHGYFNIIQRNAIKSWTLLRPKCEIILFGDEEGVAEIASEFGARHIPEIERNEFGTPLLGPTFNVAKELAHNRFLASVSCDIILMNDFPKAVAQIKEDPFLMVGQRWNLDIKKEINFHELDWEKKLRHLIRNEGKRYGLSAIDYFVFPRHFKLNFPPFIIGAPGWDNWLIYQARFLKTPVIDATKVVTIVHQDHGRARRTKDFFQIEQQRNFQMAGGLTKMMNLLDADWVLTPIGLKRPEFPRNIFSKLSLFYPWRVIIAFRRKLRQLFKFLQ